MIAQQKVQMTESRAQAVNTCPIVGSGISGTLSFHAHATEEELTQLSQYIAPISSESVRNILDHYGTALARAAADRSPYTPIQCHRLAGELLPFFPPEFVSGIWYIIDPVGRRIYSKHF